MAAAHQSLRRRAAWAVLAPVMDEDALIEALWLQHDTLRGDSVSDIIAFIDAVAARHLLDAATRKRLYAAYFEALRQPEDNLPIDPWPLMVPARPGAAAPAPRPASPMPGMAWPGGQPGAPSAAGLFPAGMTPGWSAGPAPGVGPAAVAPAGIRAPAGPATPDAAVPVPVAAPPDAAAPGPVPPASAAGMPAHQAVFAVLAHGLASGMRQFHAGELADWVADSRARLDRLRLPAALRQAAGRALTTPDATAWVLEGSVEQLASVTHELYVALCEAVGPVAADQMLVQAVREAEQHPQARQVPPSRFL